jgi:hypothetical protein
MAFGLSRAYLFYLFGLGVDGFYLCGKVLALFVDQSNLVVMVLVGSSVERIVEVKG